MHNVKTFLLKTTHTVHGDAYFTDVRQGAKHSLGYPIVTAAECRRVVDF